MRADRLLSIVMLLQVNGKMTCSALAKKLEVSERTILRDMEALSAAGIPIFSDRGVGGGWQLLGDYQTKLTGLNESEVLSLFLPQPEDVLSDLGLNNNSKSVFLKLLSSLPSSYQKSARFMQERIYVDTAAWKKTESSIDLLPLLQEAIWNEVNVNIIYQYYDKISERTISPLGLVAKGSAWYLIGIVEGDVRTYRISRIEKASITSDYFVRPNDFNLEDYWKKSSSEFIKNLPKYPVSLKIVKSTLLKIKISRYWKIINEEQTSEDNWIKLDVEFETEDDACENLLGFGTQVEVLEPESLRMKVIETAAKVVEFYKEMY